MQRGDPTGGCPRGEAVLPCSARRLALQVPPAVLVGSLRRIVKEWLKKRWKSTSNQWLITPQRATGCFPQSPQATPRCSAAKEAA